MALQAQEECQILPQLPRSAKKLMSALCEKLKKRNFRLLPQDNLLGHDATTTRHDCDQACSCTVPCRSAAARCRAAILIRFLIFTLCSWSELLTSSDWRQIQQNVWWQRLHAICAQPSSRSIGTWHDGQRLIGAFTSDVKGTLEHKKGLIRWSKQLRNLLLIHGS